MKINTLDKHQMNKLEKHGQVHNLGEERMVSLLNYELAIRGKQNLGTASKSVLNKSVDLINSANVKMYRDFRKNAFMIKEKWTEKLWYWIEAKYSG